MISASLIKYGLAAVALIVAITGIHHHGVVSGKASERAHWEPLFQAAEKAAAEANAKTAAIESAQTAATVEAEARHADEVTAINTRYADAERRIRALSVRLAANSASRCEVSSVPNAAAVPDEPTPSEERAERAGDAIADVGRRCELDASALDGLQQWVREQAALNH